MKRALLLLWLGPTALFGQESLYLGAEACRDCHPKAFEAWSASRHARAQSALPPENAGTLRCLFCHGTDAQKNLSSRRLDHVQCEACHGPGARHVTLASTKDEKSPKPGGLEPVSVKTCLRCHTDVRSPRIRPFDYERSREAIRHWETPAAVD